MNRIEIWNNYMKCYDGLMELQAYRDNLKDILKRISPKPQEQILDAGSGTGNLSIQMKECGANILSLDFSPEALAVHLSKDPAACTLQASLEDPLPLDSNTQDKICCASVLFSLSKNGRALATREFFRVLKPGKMLLVTAGTKQASLATLIKLYYLGLRKSSGRFPAALGVIFSLNKILPILYYNWRLQKLPPDEGFTILREEELSNLLKDSGFTDIEMDRTYGNSFLLITARKPLN